MHSRRPRCDKARLPITVRSAALKPILLATLVLALATASQAAEVDRRSPRTEQPPLSTKIKPDGSMRRYHQLRRLHSRERGRPVFQAGANCVTPKLVCWVPKASARAGAACSCSTPALGKVAGKFQP